MPKWIKLGSNCLFRPIRNGLELLRPEETISIEIPGIQKTKLSQKLSGIFNGYYEASKMVKALNFGQILKNLQERDVIKFSSKKIGDEPKNINSAEEILFKIREKVVGTKGPVVTLYWLDRKKSKFSPKQVNFFSAKYLRAAAGKNKARIEWAYGADEDLRIAELKAVMEAIERFSLEAVETRSLLKTSARKLGKRAINPSNVIVYSKNQYRNGLKFLPFSREAIYFWKEVTSLNDGSKCFLPVECVYSINTKGITPRPYTCSNSSGVAAGFTFEESILRGIYECIERDAFMIVWLNRLEMPALPRNLKPPQAKEDMEALKELGYKVFFIDITLDLLPVILCVAIAEHSIPSLILGCAANPEIKSAAQKAFVEVEQQIYWCLREKSNISVINDQKQVKKVRDHMRLYASYGRHECASFL